MHVCQFPDTCSEKLGMSGSVPRGSGQGDLRITSSDGLVVQLYFSARTFSSDFSVLALKLFQSEERDKGERKISFPSKLIIKPYGHWASAEITTDKNTRNRAGTCNTTKQPE